MSGAMEIQLNSGVFALGMSITAGAFAANVSNYWVNRFASFVGGAVENRALSGTGLPSMAAQSNAFAPYSGRTKIGLVDGPLNDVRQAGGACLPSVKPALDAIISSLFWGSNQWSCRARPSSGKQAVATVIDGLSPGPHTIRVKPPSSGIPAGKACVVDGVQCPLMAAPVLLGSVPNIADWSALGSMGSWADAKACNSIIQQVADNWRDRGLPVQFVDLEKFVNPERDYAADGIHPTDRGHLIWALGYLAATRIRA